MNKFPVFFLTRPNVSRSVTSNSLWSMDFSPLGSSAHGIVQQTQVISQSYVFPSSHVHIWEMGHKEGWAPNNWCFWTVVLEKTLESSFDNKKIKPVNPKGNQPWLFTGRTDAEAPICWPPDLKNWLIGKDPNAGKDGQEEKGVTGWDSWMASLTQWMWVRANRDSEGQESLACCSPWGCKESDTTEWLNCTEPPGKHMYVHTHTHKNTHTHICINMNRKKALFIYIPLSQNFQKVEADSSPKKM